MSGKCIKVDVTGVTTLHTYPEKKPTLPFLQELVGGYIEHVNVMYNRRKHDAYVDEDGLPKELKVNSAALLKYSPSVNGYSIPLIVGPLVIVVPDEV